MFHFYVHWKGKYVYFQVIKSLKIVFKTSNCVEYSLRYKYLSSGIYKYMSGLWQDLRWPAWYRFYQEI
jgi:hypothetical protein